MKKRFYCCQRETQRQLIFKNLYRAQYKGKGDLCEKIQLDSRMLHSPHPCTVLLDP